MFSLIFKTFSIYFLVYCPTGFEFNKTRSNVTEIPFLHEESMLQVFEKCVWAIEAAKTCIVDPTCSEFEYETDNCFSGTEKRNEEIFCQKDMKGMQIHFFDYNQCLELGITIDLYF